MEALSRQAVIAKLHYAAQMRRNASANAQFRDLQVEAGYDPDFCFYVRQARRAIEYIRKHRGADVSECAMPWN